MDRAVWQATVHEVVRVESNLVTKPHIHTHTHTHTHTAILLNHKKSEILLALSEISQRQILYDISYRNTYRHRKQTQLPKGRGEAGGTS